MAIAVGDCEAANRLIDRGDRLIDRGDRCCDGEHGVRVGNGDAHRVQKERSAAVEQAQLLLQGSKQHGRRALRCGGANTPDDWLR